MDAQLVVVDARHCLLVTMHTRQNNVVACVVPLAGTEPGGAVCDRVVVVVLVSGTEFAPFMVPVTVGYKYN